MFYTGSNKPIEFNAIPDALLNFYKKMNDYDSQYDIIIGTDSQNFHDTKIVSVIAMICQGHGGIFFYKISHEPKIRNVKQKLHKETGDSLTLAYELIDMLEAEEKYEDMYLSCPISIHIDAGNSKRGKTRELIPELIGWVNACNFKACVKPDSFVSSSIADRISK